MRRLIQIAHINPRPRSYRALWHFAAELKIVGEHCSQLHFPLRAVRGIRTFELTQFGERTSHFNRIRQMLQRRPLFPHVIEMNHQAGQRMGCNVYLVFDKNEWVLIDVGFEETVDEIVDLIRQLDFPLSNCKTIIATHADVDHIQGLAQMKQALKADGHRPSPRRPSRWRQATRSRRLPKLSRRTSTWQCRR